MRDRFTTIGIGPAGSFHADELTPEMRSAIEGGIADAWAEFDALKKDKIDTGQVGSADLFGTAQYLAGNYLYRMAGAVLGIYGNSKDEAIYPGSSSDSTGQPLTGADRYTYHFASGQLPPVNAFWSLTMYELPHSLLVANPMHRYLINSPMMSSLIKDPDGGITLYIQNESPRRRQGGQLATRAQGAVPGDPAAVLAETRCAERYLEGPATGQDLTAARRSTSSVAETTRSGWENWM